jgi:formyl-CoA transferase
VTALMGAFAISAALTKRHDPDFEGEWIDLALFESLYRLIEWQVIVYDQLGIPVQRAGNQLPVAPGSVINTYPTADDTYVSVTAGTPRAAQNIVRLLGLTAEEFDDIEKHGSGRDYLDNQLREWTSTRTAADALKQMHAHGIVVARVYSAADIVEDPIYAERNDVITVEDPNLGPVRMQAVIPKLLNHAGHVWRTGPALGEDNDLVYQTYLGVTDERYARLRAAGTI